MGKEGFEKLLLEAIDEGLSWMGESSKQAIYFYLETGFNIKRSEVPARIDDFGNAIEKIFGSGAKVIQVQIMRQLHQKLRKVSNCSYRVEDFVFIDYVEAARRNFPEKRELKLAP